MGRGSGRGGEAADCTLLGPIFIYPNECVGEGGAASAAAGDNTQRRVSKRPSAAVISTSVSLCLHGRSLVVGVITARFGMKSQSQYGSVCLPGAAPQWMRKNGRTEERKTCEETCQSRCFLFGN